MNPTTGLIQQAPVTTLAGPQVATLPRVKPAADTGRKDFIVSLESARGLAALSVALFHSFHLLKVDGYEHIFNYTLWNYETTNVLWMRLLMIPFNGGAAVSLFFVLSGYVLTLSLRRDDRPFWPKTFSFAGRRFLRIYPPLAVNLILMAAAIAALIMVFPGAAIDHPTWKKLGINLLLYNFPVDGVIPYFPINGATWTLLIELVVIPFLLLAWMLRTRFGIAGTIFFLVASIVLLIKPNLTHNMMIGTFLFMFAIGVLIADIGDKFSSLFTRITAPLCLAVALVVLLSARFLLGYVVRDSYIAEAVSAGVIVAVLAYGPRLPIHRILEASPLRFLGRTSYSFYLYHPMALAITAGILFPYVTQEGLQAHPFGWSSVVALITIAATIPLGWASFTFVEKPMVRLGRKI